jgi:hypothetical protein
MKARLRAAQGTVLRVRRVSAVAALLAFAACSPGAEPGNEAEAEVEAAPSASPPPAPPAPAPAAGGGKPSASSAATARRCGWLHNPTPGNWWLVDRDGEWVLAAQGGRQAAGMEEMPDMSEAGWQEVNGHYGYGCACLTITADPATREVAAVAAPEPKPLAICRADRALPAP